MNPYMANVDIDISSNNRSHEATTTTYIGRPWASRWPSYNSHTMYGHVLLVHARMHVNHTLISTCYMAHWGTVGQFTHGSTCTCTNVNNTLVLSLVGLAVCLAIRLGVCACIGLEIHAIPSKRCSCLLREAQQLQCTHTFITASPWFCTHVHSRIPHKFDTNFQYWWQKAEILNLAETFRRKAINFPRILPSQLHESTYTYAGLHTNTH